MDNVRGGTYPSSAARAIDLFRVAESTLLSTGLVGGTNQLVALVVCAAAAGAAAVESRTIVEAFLSAARGGDLERLLSLLAPDAVMRADLVGQSIGAGSVYDGADAVAERMNGAKGALPVTIDGQLGAAWIAAGTVKVAFVFHVADGHVQEIELIADPDVLTTLDIQRL